MTSDISDYIDKLKRIIETQEQVIQNQSALIEFQDAMIENYKRIDEISQERINLYKVILEGDDGK